MKEIPKNKLIVIIFIWSCILLLRCQGTLLKSRIKTEQIYRSSNVASDLIYSIDVNRMSSSNEAQGSRCKSVPRSIAINNKQELFRLSKGNITQNRNQKVYQKLTSLNEQENIIEQFQIIGSSIFLITTDGNGYFIDHSTSTVIKKVKTGFFESQTAVDYDLIVIKQFRERALIINRNKIVLCRSENDQCGSVQGYNPVQGFRGAELFQNDGKYYIFIITGPQIITYELTANGKLKSRKIYQKEFFGAAKISIRGLYKAENNRILVLDDLQGIRVMIGVDGLQIFKTQAKLVYEQFGCYQIVGQDKGESLVIACAPSQNSFFMLKLMKSRQYTQVTYEPHQTVFMHEKLYQIDYIQNILLSRVFSGIKLYWSSKQIGNPYPYFYRNAGNLFLHNAIQAKIKVINGVKIIFVAAQDQLLRFQLKNTEPYVTCFSSKQINEEYNLKYIVPCSQQSFMNQESVCSKEQSLNFEVWQHKEIRITTLLLPFIFSFLGVIFLSFAIYKIFKRYSTDVQSARLKFNIDQNQLDS